MFLDGFSFFQVIPRFSKYIDVLLKKFRLTGACSGNSFVRERLGK